MRTWKDVKFHIWQNEKLVKWQLLKSEGEVLFHTSLAITCQFWRPFLVCKETYQLAQGLSSPECYSQAWIKGVLHCLQPSCLKCQATTNVTDQQKSKLSKANTQFSNLKVKFFRQWTYFWDFLTLPSLETCLQSKKVWAFSCLQRVSPAHHHPWCLSLQSCSSWGATWLLYYRWKG